MFPFKTTGFYFPAYLNKNSRISPLWKTSKLRYTRRSEKLLSFDLASTSSGHPFIFSAMPINIVIAERVEEVKEVVDG